jgi:putative chitinase
MQADIASSDPAAAAAAMLLNRTHPLDRLAQALRAIAPNLTAPDIAAWEAALRTPMQREAIATPKRAAAFLGQCAVESGGFRALTENLGYSAPRLRQIWPNRFPTEAAAQACANNPEKLANTVYANRLGNGPPESGDGWTFRGRGLIQLTGRSGYGKFAEAMGMDLQAAIAHAETRQGAADSAAWFWSTNALNPLADAWMLNNITRRVNGGTLGAPERARLAQAALTAIGA